MKKTQNPLMIISPGQIRRQKPDLEDSLTVNYTKKKHEKPYAALVSFRTVARKVLHVFSSLLSRHKKAKSGKLQDHPSTRQGQVDEVSFSLSSSTGRGSLKSLRSKHSTSDAFAENETMLFKGGLSFEVICKATGNFSKANIIGEGGFGTVYRGQLRNGFVFAVKRARKETCDRSSVEFKNEIAALSKIEHMSLVRFYGYVEHGDERLILVEYVHNGTLREHLDGIQGKGLELAERLDIAIDIAHGITYLHTYTDPAIIHRDIKASNILITEKLRAKVADFGFARLSLEEPGATHISTQVKGTAGYLDPEYLRSYQLTEKSDVYSFGVLLVEMVTGRRPIESKRNKDERVTVRWALRRLKDGETAIAMDPRLPRSVASIQAVERVLKLARQCLAPSRQSRPSMRKCAEVLWEIRKDFREACASHAAGTSFHSANVVERHARRGWQDSLGTETNHSLMFVSA